MVGCNKRAQTGCTVSFPVKILNDLDLVGPNRIQKFGYVTTYRRKLQTPRKIFSFCS